jgi:photosystem II stability/assembly factor-like uncharacterized protein
MNKQKINCLLVFLFLLGSFKNVESQFLFNYSRIQETDINYKKNREKWLRDMHRCAPDINYEVINKENRLAKLKLNKRNLKEKPLKIFNKQILLDTFANGKIIGQWSEKGSNNQAGRIHIIDVDFQDNTIYAASAGGNIWKGTINGDGWICLNNSMQIRNIRMVKILRYSDKNRILVVGNSPAGVYYTDNEGLTWEKSTGLEIPASWGWFNRGIVTNSQDPIIYVLGTEWDYNEWKSISCLYRSLDYGIKFEPVLKLNLNANLMDIWTPKYENDKVFLIYKDTISTVNKDGTIENIASGKIVIEYSDINQILLNGNYADGQYNLYTSINRSGNDSTFFFYSSNGGKDWEYRGNLKLIPFEKNSFNVSSLNPNNIYIGGVDTYRSYDGGRSWELVNYWWEYYNDIINKLHADIPGIMIFRNPFPNEFDEYIFIATDGGLYVSKDSLKTVKNISLKGLNVSQYYSTYTAAPKVSDFGALFAGSQDQGFQRCINDSNTILSFQQTISGDYGHLTSSDGGKTLWTVYPGFAMVYKDLANSSISSVNFWDFKGKGGLWMPPIIALPDKPNFALVAAGGINNDEAQIWQLELKEEAILSLVFPYNFNQDKSNSKISAISVSPLDNKYLFVLTNNGKFFSSTNYGETWSKLDSFSAPSSHYFYGSNIEPSLLDVNKLYIAGAGYSNPSVFVSYDRGKSFIAIDNGLPRTLVYDIAVTPDGKDDFCCN